jgi:3-oxoacyl-[acyl-carrier-protein] synthase-1
MKSGAHRIDYINAHGSGSKRDDALEIEVLKTIFGSASPLVSSTKGLSGHAQGAAGAHEAIFTILMLHHNFVAHTANLESVAPECEGVHHVLVPMELPLKTAMTFNIGLGGSNACLIFRKLSA